MTAFGFDVFLRVMCLLHFGPGTISFRQLEPCLLEFQERFAEGSGRAVKISALGVLQVMEKPTHPGLDVGLEKLALGCQIDTVLGIDKQRHRFANAGGMVFHFAAFFAARNTEALQIAAQCDQRLVHQKAGQVPTGVRQQLAPAKAYEKIVEFVIEGAGFGSSGGFGQTAPGS
ncbi:MAG: hypothetical protein RQ741_02660 [Wenzhouxiangellaceae bacterium]|nr:hypothetical protein [Wenzhouxiangellaceae bacterium]